MATCKQGLVNVLIWPLNLLCHVFLLNPNSGCFPVWGVLCVHVGVGYLSGSNWSGIRAYRGHVPAGHHWSVQGVLVHITSKHQAGLAGELGKWPGIQGSKKQQIWVKRWKDQGLRGSHQRGQGLCASYLWDLKVKSECVCVYTCVHTHIWGTLGWEDPEPITR